MRFGQFTASKESSAKLPAMRIATWNCNMAFDRKATALEQLRPDIAIIQEVARPEILRKKAPRFSPTAFEWVGHNDNKGMAVFAFGSYRLTRPTLYDPSIRHVLPLSVTGPNSFSLFAVWAFMDRKYMSSTSDPGPMNKAIDRYSEILGDGNAVVAGDFNNHSKWDKRGNPRNFSTLVDRFSGFGLFSAYHELNSLRLGEERLPTHYWRDRKEDSPHNCHIDFMFVPKGLLKDSARIEIGRYADWCGNGMSDHVPLVLDV